MLAGRLCGQHADAGYFILLLKLLLSFTARRQVSLSELMKFSRNSLGRKGMTAKDLIFMLYDFHIDSRYDSVRLSILLSLLQTCIQTFFPARKELIPRITNLLKNFLRISGSTSQKHLKIIFETFVHNSRHDLSEWVEEGARFIRKHGEKSKSVESYFKRESDLSRRIWDGIDTGISYESVAKRLQTFVNAITEKEVPLKSNRAFPWEQNSELFYTDGKSIFIPHYVNYVGSKEKNFTVLLHSVAHECAHIEFGSFAENKKKYTAIARLLEKHFPGMYRRNQREFERLMESTGTKLREMGYLMSPAQMIPDKAPLITRLCFRAEFPRLLQDLWNVVEDYRVNLELYTHYPGYRNEKSVVDEIDFDRTEELDRLAGAAHLLSAFVQHVWFGKLKGRMDGRFLPCFETMRTYFTKFKRKKKHDNYATFHLAVILYIIFLRFLEAEMPDFLAALRDGKSRVIICFLNLGVSYYPRNTMLQIEMARMKAGSTGSVDKDSGDRSEKCRSSRDTLRDATAKVFGRNSHAPELDRGRIFFYPEWDHEISSYIADRCVLVDAPVEVNGPEKIDNLSVKFKGYIEQVKRAFMKMKPERLYERKGMDEGHEVDFDCYFDALMDDHSGRQMMNNFYIIREKKIRSVLSSLVLDMSPSTTEKIMGEPIFLHEKYATYLLSEAINMIGDTFGIFSYFDYGPAATYFYSLKDFDEPYDKTHYNRLCSFQPAWYGFSRLSVGLRHLIERIKEYEMKSKIIFFITDGLPYYFEEAIDEGEKSKSYFMDGVRVDIDKPVPVLSVVSKGRYYIRHDLRKVYEEAVMAGIHLFCITLDQGSVRFMEEIFGTSLVYLPDVSELPRRLIEIFRKVTT